jgi:hypothetical protein
MDTSITANSYRSRQAMAVLGARQTEFTINEFGDEGTVCFKDLERTLLSNKTPQEQKKNIENTVNLLKSKKVAVMRPNSERATTKNLKPKLGFWEAVGATFAYIFNVPTKARAHRMQNEMEYRFGRAAANMINLSYLKVSNPENAGIAVAQEGIRKNLTEFLDRTDTFVARYKLGKADANATEKCENQIISRLVNSLVNSLKGENGKISGDVSQLERLLDTAKNWSRPASANEAEGKIYDRMDRIMNALKTEIETRLEAERAAQGAEAAPPTGLKGVVETVKNTLKSVFENWKNSLKSTLEKKTRELKDFCDSISGEMGDIQEAFERISKDLEAELKGVVADFSHKDLNEQAITDAENAMDKHIGNAIQKGREIIDRRLKKELAAHKAETRRELFVGNRDHSKMDVGETNKKLSEMLNHTVQTVEDAEKTLKENPRGSLNYLSRRYRKENIAEATKQLQDTKLLSSQAITAVNKAIGQFAATRTELLQSIRPTLAKIELANQLEKKESNPPANVDQKAWKDACQTVGKFLQDDKSNNLYDMPSSAVGLIREHKDHFLEGLGADAKKRLGQVFAFQNLQAGFDESEIDHLGYAGKVNNGSCSHMSQQFYDELRANVIKLDEKVFNPNPDDTAVDREIKDSILRIMTDELDDTCIAANSGKEKTGVEDTKENRENGVFIDTGIDFEKNAVSKCWVSNEDAERLVLHLTTLIGKVDVLIAQKSAQLLEKTIDVASASGDEKPEEIVFEDIKLDGSSSAWNDEYSKARLRQIEKAQDYLKPIVTAYRDARAIVAVNALERLRTDLQAIRSAGASNDEIVKLCNTAEYAIREAGSDVGRSVEALIKLYDKITNDESLAKDVSLAVDLDKFAENIDRLSFYGERGDGVFSANVGSVHLDRTIKLMDNLMIAQKRSRDIMNLVSNSLESVRNLVAAVDNATHDQFSSDWFKTRGLSISQDKLRKNFSDYTKNVIEYVQTLMDDQIKPDSDKRTAAAENVRKSLAACYSSLAPIVGFLTDFEVFIRDKFVNHDILKAKLDDELAKEAEKTHPNNTALQNEFIKNGQVVIDRKLYKAFHECYNVDVDKKFTETRRSIHNVFAAIGEISRSHTVCFGDSAAEDKLNISSADAKLLHADWGAVNEDIKVKDLLERNKMDDPALNDTFNQKIDTGGLNDYKLAVNEARRTYRTEFNLDSASQSTNSRSLGLVFSDDIFRAMNTMYLMLSNAKMKKTLPETVIKEIGNLIAMRNPAMTKETLAEHLKNAVPKKDFEAFEKAIQLDDDIVSQLQVLALKRGVYGIDKEFGFAKSEQLCVSLNLYLKSAGVKDYAISAVDTLDNAVLRVAVKNEDGDEAYCTLNYDSKKKKIVFTPEMSDRFRKFSVNDSVVVKIMNEKQTMKFPFGYVDNSFVVELPDSE